MFIKQIHLSINHFNILSMSNLKMKQVGNEVNFPGYTQKTTKFYKEKGTINIKQVEKILESANRVAKAENKTMRIVRIFVVNGDKRATWKSMEEFEDYYAGRVKNVDKFHEFFQVDVTTAVDIPKKKK